MFCIDFLNLPFVLWRQSFPRKGYAVLLRINTGGEYGFSPVEEHLHTGGIRPHFHTMQLVQCAGLCLWCSCPVLPGEGEDSIRPVQVNFSQMDGKSVCTFRQFQRQAVATGIQCCVSGRSLSIAFDNGFFQQSI